MAEIKKKTKNLLLLCMPTALLQLLEGVGWMGALPRTFPLCGRGGRRSPLPGRISKQKLNQNRFFLTGIKELQFHPAEKPALPWDVWEAEWSTEWSWERNGHSSAWDSPVVAGMILLLFAFKNNSSFQSFQLSTVNPSSFQIQPWTVQSMFNPRTLWTLDAQVSHSIAYSLLCLCLDLTFQHPTWDILIHFLLKTDQLFPCNMPHTFHVLSKAE